MELVTPSLERMQAFAVFYQDFEIHDVDNAEYYREGVSDFPKYVQRLIDEEKGVNLRQGYVPCSHFWLLDSEQKILGAIRVRHHINNEFLSSEGGHIGYDIAPSYRGAGYGKHMLKLVLPKANALGIERALVTADEDNVASRRVIESNGGELENIVMGEVFPNPIARYWVECIQG
ncbi:GNAT family N-acetyltransferase [Vibrio mediterranei]|uniref:GNAT family N-acetyltransferase n=1 Tax=Vibrio mediterranei TaxID=689 RepID=A0A3G4VI24_9VIBR|nr:GNAT family N-acetyltransferase [Vibrio mediterranei]AYV24487.1 GNAT family N-acetyltransferase [Vibrio mediterranei]